MNTSKVQKEIYKDIPDYEGYYQVSDLGNVKSLSRWVKHSLGGIKLLKEKMLKPVITEGRNVFTLSKKGKRRRYKGSVLSAMTFLGHKPDGTRKIVVDHKNNNPLDDRLVNLQVITQRENSSKDRKGYTSKYIGVSKTKNIKNKWVAKICIDGKDKHLGYFAKELDASKAYQTAKANITK